jgi:hypothetical protein
MLINLQMKDNPSSTKGWAFYLSFSLTLRQKWLFPASS